MEGKQRVALTFALYQNEALVRRETITQDIVKVGKDAKSHLRVDDELASRMHAVIEVASPQDITLIDLGNEPGTMVNGARVNKCKISPGDQLQIGGTKIMLERAEPVAVAAAASPAKPVPANPFAAAPAAAPANPFAAAPANPFAAAPANPFAATAGAADPFAYNNPFAQSAPAVDEVPPDAPEGSYTYTLVKNGPDVPADEIEVQAASVEIMILWDAAVLHVAHLTPPRSFYVGEEEGKNFKCDFFIPSEKLGTTRAPIVLADRSGSVSVVLLPRATGTIEIPGQPKMTVQQAIDGGRAQPSAELSGAYQMQLPSGAKAKVELDGIVFQVSVVNAGRVVAGHFQLDTQSLLYTGLSMAVHLGLLAAMAFFMPPLGATDEDGISADQQFLIQQYLAAAAEKEMEEKETEQVADNAADNKEGGTGTRAKGEEGSMGNPNTKATGNRYGVQGPADNPDPHIARQAALRDAAEFGMIGLLNAGAGGDPNAPTAPWGRDDSLGNDALSARGNMWGDQIGDSFGAGGLGLSGIGEGGGGRGEGIGLGSIGTIGHGAGTGTGQGFGSGHGRLGGSHRTKPPQVRMGATSVSGRLPPEVIQRIVRQNFGRFRLCYENGLRNNPNLQGRVAVRFVIGRDGAVSNVGNGGSDLPDNGVVSCVVRAFYGLSFPQPEGGIVTVVYPIMLSPGG
ncbi:phosphopeptide-binding protein [Sorangium cellulosum]|uniref:Phosphopeptide-binding protein n=1 Tax=Sorangium cellulosum TaxID=56 RepID=A0A2L0ERK1_SORCE|nr:AgmX/PglI C-terminal domain-containing protein [Sorangium cellulosum]AUX41931.1 phosphopeptide-binding protein [Sorangium cellulosum]